MKPDRRFGIVGAVVTAGVCALAAGGLALAQSVTPGSPNATAPEAQEGEAPPAAVAPPVSAIPAAPTPPVPESEIAPIPQASARPRPAREAAKPAPEPKRALYNAAVLQALDKVTTETLRFEAQLNRPVRYKGLIFTVHTCQVEPAGVRPPAEAHLQIISQPIPLAGRASTPAREVFRGWMFAEAPGVHPFEHPVYDVWLIACKTAAPVNAGRR